MDVPLLQLQTDMFQTRPNTIELSGITMELDALHKAYVAIYSEAPTQLENIDVTDAHIRRIADRLKADTTFASHLGKACTTQLAETIAKADAESINDTKPLVGLIDVLTSRILKNIGSEVEALINTMVEARVQPAIDAAVATAVANASEVKRGTDAIELINQLLQLTTNDQTTETTTEDKQNTTES